MNLLITALSSATGPSGICRHACNLARCAATCDDIEAVTFAVGSWQKKYFADLFKLSDPKITIVSVDVSNSAYARNSWYLRDLPALAIGVRADLVHLSFPVPVRRSSLPCPTVVSLHDLYPYDEPNNFGFPKVFFNRVFLYQCLKEVDCIACVSEATLSRLRIYSSRLADKNAMVVPNCVTILREDAVATADAGRQFFLVVAQHRANKNISLALDVFDELLRKRHIGTQTLLIVVGNQGPETRSIKETINRRALEKSVKLIHAVSDGELRWLYENCELLMAPSSTEGFGLPVAEAVLCGSRVVCSNIPAFREVGAEACHYFDLHTESEKSAMVEAVCHSLREPVKRRAHLEEFSIQSAAREYATLYMRLHRDAFDR